MNKADEIIELILDWIDKVLPRNEREFIELLGLILWFGAISGTVLLFIVNYF